MEFNLKYYVHQHRRRGCLVLTRADAWRDPEDAFPPVDKPWQSPLRPPPSAISYLKALNPEDGNYQTWRVPSDLVVQLSPETRSPSWPGIPEFTRILGDRAGTVMRAYGKPEGFPYLWYSQITPFGDSFRWLTPENWRAYRASPTAFQSQRMDAMPTQPSETRSPHLRRDFFSHVLLLG